MNAQPLLARVARALAEPRLEAVLIGNAAAALQGAPVTTLDFDFCFRATAVNARKLRVFAEALGATLSRPHEPVSDMVRVERDDIQLQVDFLPDQPIGMAFCALRSRATRMAVAGETIWVADLADVAEGKRRANRGKDRAVLHVIEATMAERARRDRASR